MTRWTKDEAALYKHMVGIDETAETVSGADLREAFIWGFDAALNDASRDPVGARTDIEKRMFYRGYDALACERYWLETNR